MLIDNFRYWLSEDGNLAVAIIQDDEYKVRLISIDLTHLSGDDDLDKKIYRACLNILNSQN